MDQNGPYIADSTEIEDSLTTADIESITDESESVRAAVVGPDGLSRRDDGDERRVDVTVVLVETDRRIVFAEADALATAAGSIRFPELGGTDVDANGITLTTTDGVIWRFPFPEGDDRLERIAAELRWLGRVRGAVVAASNDVDLAAGTIRTRAAARDWEDGDAAYRDARGTLDDVIGMVQRTAPIDEEVLAPELTGLERTLECAYAELLIERASSRLTLGQQLMENGDIRQAADVLEDARADHAAATLHADAVERGDAFRFGEQRELEDRLQRLDWEMQAVAAEPLRQAHEAKMLARSTSDPDETVEHWERAFERFGTVLALDWGGDDRYVAEDPAAVREELANAAGQLLAVHGTLARTNWDAGVDHQAAGEAKPAINRLSTAADHLERAHELAEEFRPDAAPEMARRLDSMREGLERLRYHASPADVETPDSAPADDPSTAREAPAAISAAELSELDAQDDDALESAPDVEAPEEGEGAELVLDGSDAA